MSGETRVGERRGERYGRGVTALFDPSTVVSTHEGLDVIYGEPLSTSLTKEIDHLIPETEAYIEASPFVVVATSGSGGLDSSPRGDPAGFVRVHDSRTLLMPDRRGNNRVDTLRNLVDDPGVVLLFLVPGVGVTLRVNGTAVLTTDADLRASFSVGDKIPATIVVITIESVYTQCPKALIRSRLWDPAGFRDPSELPTVGTIMAAITAGDFDGATYDANYPQRIKDTVY